MTDLKDSVHGIYGGQAWKEGNVVKFMFLNGAKRPVDLRTLKATLEDKGSMVDREIGVTVIHVGVTVHVYYGHQTLTFPADDLYLMVIK